MVFGCRWKIMGTGIKRTISISKTRKITARRKNRKEKGVRADPIGSNPHSNEDSFSRSCLIIDGWIIHTTIRHKHTTRARRKVKRERFIEISGIRSVSSFLATSKLPAHTRRNTYK